MSTIKRSFEINSLEELNELEVKLLSSINTTFDNLKNELDKKSPAELLYKMKFSAIGRDPLEDRNLNIIEQLNQLFTYKVSFQGVKYLLKNNIEDSPYIVNLGTAKGYDIESKNGHLIAEVFAATKPQNNQKLLNDVKKLNEGVAKRKFVFYHSPQKHSSQEKYQAEHFVEIIFFETIDWNLKKNKFT
jgi:hypothetical protein